MFDSSIYRLESGETWLVPFEETCSLSLQLLKRCQRSTSKEPTARQLFGTWRVMHTHTSVLPQFLSPPPFLASHSFLQNLAFPKFVSNPNPQFMHSEYVGPRMRTLRPRKTVQVDRRCGASEQEGGSGEKAQQPREDNVSGFHATSRNRQCLQALVCSVCVRRD